MTQNKKNNSSNQKKYLIIVSALALVFVLLIVWVFIDDAGVFDSNNDSSATTSMTKNDTNNTQTENTTTNTPVQSSSSAFDTSVVFKTLDDLAEFDYKAVKATMTDGQTFTMNIYPDIAPITAENFLNLVSEGFYDGLTFHRVIEGFMAQGGDPEGTGMGGSDEKIVGEFYDNGYYNPLSHQRGVVSMARSMDYNSASSQFFICYDDVSSSLDGQYATFGIVTEGMDVIDSFLSDGTDGNDKPLKDVRIKSMTIVE